jgi:Zn-dependent protease with chaperone function
VNASTSGVLLRVLLWLYFPFLAFLWLGIAIVESFLLVKMWFLFVPVTLFMVLLAVPFCQIPWACRSLFWDLPQDENEIRLSRQKMQALVEFVERLADERELPVPDRIRFSAETVAHVYESEGGEKVLVLGGLAMRSFSQDVLAGIIAHELGHFAAGDTRLSRKCHRRRILMQVLESNLLLVIKPSEDSEIVQASDRILNPMFWAFLNILNPLPWVIVGYHRLFELVYASHSRQEEYAADRYSVQQVGKQVASADLIYLGVLPHLPWASLDGIAELYLETNTTVDQIFAEQARRAGGIDPSEWRQACRKALAERTGWFDSHPCLKERLAAMGVSSKQAHQLELDPSSLPATALVADWEMLERRMTGQLMRKFHERYQWEQDMKQVDAALLRRITGKK